MVWFYRWLEGFLKVRMCGENTRRAMGLCAERGVLLRHTKPEKNGLVCYCSVGDFKRLHSVLSGKGIRVRILGKFGLPFWVHRYRFRFGIPVGVILFFGVMVFLSGRIWVIEVKGNTAVPTQNIMKDLKESHIDIGSYADAFSFKTEREKLLLKEEKLAWCSLNRDGCRLTVKVTEANPIPEKKQYSHFVAKSDGVILKINLTEGDCLCRVGDTVKKGERLVSGIVDREGIPQQVRCRGEIIALTQKEMRLFESFSQTERIPTGRRKTQYGLELFGIRIPLYLGKTRGRFELEKREKQWQWKGNPLPGTTYTGIFTFFREEKVTYSKEELKNRLLDSQNRYVEKRKETDCRPVRSRFNEKNGGMELVFETWEKENIVLEEVF